MSSTSVAPAKYWGYLIKPDKSASPVFEQLLLGVANYINRHVAPWDTPFLTPAKLATFYRLVGGDYDPLFLDTPPASLSFIYQSLGCFHTLQPEKDPYSPPTVPALTPQGFVRWQTVQLLLEPDEHGPFLQEAVKRFELTNPADGELFPSHLPRESLPSKPDAQMVEWHDSVSEKLMLEAQASTMRNMPPRPPMALSNGDLADTARPTSADTRSVDISTDSTSTSTAAPYFAQPRTFFQNRPPPAPTSSPYKRTGDRGNGIPARQASAPRPEPLSPLRRRSSMPPDNTHHRHGSHGPTWAPFDPRQLPPSTNVSRPSAHTRTSSSLSTSSCTSDSSYTTSSASLSPVLRPVRTLPTNVPPPFDRRHSSFQSTPRPNSTSSGGRPMNHQPVFTPFYDHPQPPSGSSGVYSKNRNLAAPVQKPYAPPISPSKVPEYLKVSGGETMQRPYRSSTVRAPASLRPADRWDARNARSADGRREKRDKERERERGQSVGNGLARNGSGRGGRRDWD